MDGFAKQLEAVKEKIKKEHGDSPDGLPPLYEIKLCRGKEKGCPFYICDISDASEKLESRFKEIDFSGRMRSKVPEMVLKHNIFKIGLSGCPNACSQPQIMDIGVISGVNVIEPGPDECSGCGICASSCPAITLNENGEGITINRDECVSCGLCAVMCPNSAINTGEKGYKIIIGGKLGRRPQLALTLFKFIEYDNNKLVNIISSLAEFFLANSRPREKMADVVNRYGVAEIAESVAETGGR